MQDRPTAHELLTTIVDVLENQVMPVLQDPHRHYVRVAANLCQIIDREIAQGPAHDARERQLLSALTGLPEDTDTLEMNKALVDKLNSGHDPKSEHAAWEALVEIVRGKLAIAKPGYDSYDFHAETGV